MDSSAIKLTRKQLIASIASQKRKIKARLQKQSPDAEVTNDMISGRLCESHLDRIKGMLPLFYKNGNTTSQFNSARIVARKVLPYKPLERFVLWISEEELNCMESALTREIEKFAEYVGVNEIEDESRKYMVDQLKEAILSKWPEAEINQFGSYAAGLSTFLSDIDISILGLGVGKSDKQKASQTRISSETVEYEPISLIEDEKRKEEFVNLVGEEVEKPLFDANKKIFEEWQKMKQKSHETSEIGTINTKNSSEIEGNLVDLTQSGGEEEQEQREYGVLLTSPEERHVEYRPRTVIYLDCDDEEEEEAATAGSTVSAAANDANGGAAVSVQVLLQVSGLKKEAAAVEEKDLPQFKSRAASKKARRKANKKARLLLEQQQQQSQSQSSKQSLSQELKDGEEVEVEASEEANETDEVVAWCVDNAPSAVAAAAVAPTANVMVNETAAAVSMQGILLTRARPPAEQSKRRLALMTQSTIPPPPEAITAAAASQGAAVPPPITGGKRSREAEVAACSSSSGVANMDAEKPSKAVKQESLPAAASSITTTISRTGKSDAVAGGLVPNNSSFESLVHDSGDAAEVVEQRQRAQSEQFDNDSSDTSGVYYGSAVEAVEDASVQGFCGHVVGEGVGKFSRPDSAMAEDSEGGIGEDSGAEEEEESSEPVGVELLDEDSGAEEEEESSEPVGVELLDDERDEGDMEAEQLPMMEEVEERSSDSECEDEEERLYQDDEEEAEDEMLERYLSDEGDFEQSEQDYDLEEEEDEAMNDSSQQRRMPHIEEDLDVTFIHPHSNKLVTVTSTDSLRRLQREEGEVTVGESGRTSAVTEEQQHQSQQFQNEDSMTEGEATALMNAAAGANGGGAEEEGGDVLLDADFNNCFDMDGIDDVHGRSNAIDLTAEDGLDEKERHRKQLSLLRVLLPHLKAMDYVSKLEFRSRARVPIINLIHKNGVEVDISIGVSAQDTSAIVLQLKEFCGVALYQLSAFLKIFLAQLDLDKPFTGGLGSYKLYIMIAHHIHRNTHMIEDKNHPNLGLLLLTFLKYYGSSQYLNSGTYLKVLQAEVSFDRTMRIVDIQKAFAAAHATLHGVCSERLLRGYGSDKMEQAASSASGYVASGTAGGADGRQSQQSQRQERPINPNQGIVPNPNTEHKSLNNSKSSRNAPSTSALGCLINAEALTRQRSDCLSKCERFPLLTESDKNSVANDILKAMNARMNPSEIGITSIAQIAQRNPALAARIRSFQKVEDVMRNLNKYSNSSVTQNNRYAEDGGRAGSGVPGGGGGSNGIPRKFYTMVNNGVVGASFQSKYYHSTNPQLILQDRDAYHQRNNNSSGNSGKNRNDRRWSFPPNNNNTYSGGCNAPWDRHNKRKSMDNVSDFPRNRVPPHLQQQYAEETYSTRKSKKAKHAHYNNSGGYGGVYGLADDFSNWEEVQYNDAIFDQLEGRAAVGGGGGGSSRAVGSVTGTAGGGKQKGIHSNNRWEKGASSSANHPPPSSSGKKSKMNATSESFLGELKQHGLSAVKGGSQGASNSSTSSLKFVGDNKKATPGNSATNAPPLPQQQHAPPPRYLVDENGNVLRQLSANNKAPGKKGKKSPQTGRNQEGKASAAASGNGGSSNQGATAKTEAPTAGNNTLQQQIRSKMAELQQKLHT